MEGSSSSTMTGFSLGRRRTRSLKWRRAADICWAGRRIPQTVILYSKLSGSRGSSSSGSFGFCCNGVYADSFGSSEFADWCNSNMTGDRLRRFRPPKISPKLLSKNRLYTFLQLSTKAPPRKHRSCGLVVVTLALCSNIRWTQTAYPVAAQQTNWPSDFVQEHTRFENANPNPTVYCTLFAHRLLIINV
jgi:hypothetical protein